MYTERTKELLKTQLEYVLCNSPFYQNKYSDFNKNNLLDSFDRLPFTTKAEILQDQVQYPPFGSNLCVSIDKVCRVHKTSGTTNSPVIIALTQSDIRHVLDIGGSCFIESGLLPSDIVMHCLNYNMWAGGFTDHQSLEMSGAAVVPFGVGNTTMLIQMIRQLRATAIHCTPSYLSKIEKVLQEEFNMKPKELGLRIALLGAESGLQNSTYRKAIEDKWGFKAMNANYGLSEVLSMVASECQYQHGLHFRADDKLLFEIIDVNTQQSLPICKGTSGEMVLTNLCKEAQPLVRYRTGDIVTISDTKCMCGCGQPIFEISGRTDDMLVIRGLNVFASSFASIIMRQLPRVTEEYRVLISKCDPIEEVVLQIEIKGEQSEEDVVNRIKSDIKEELNVNVQVDVFCAGTLERNDGKTKHVLRVL